MADQVYWAPSLQQSHRHGWNFAIDPSFTMPDVENALIISEYHAHQYPTEAPPIYLDGVSRDYYIPFQNSQSGFTRREGGLSATEAEITEGNNIISREMAENELPVYSQFRYVPSEATFPWWCATYTKPNTVIAMQERLGQQI